MPEFNPSSLPDLSGKVFLVTGGNAGIGYQTILFLARKNATLYMGCRSESKGNAAIGSIQRVVPKANIKLLIIDHMNFSSVVAAAKELSTKETRLHGLINNAGIMAVPFEKSKDGFESQWQTNYLSHFLLTHHLLPLLLSTARISQPGDVRIVNVTSIGHGFAPKAGIDFADINQEKGGVWSRYGQSKLANILHAKELNLLYGPNGTKRGEGEIWSMAVHPGNVYTDLAKKATTVGGVISVILNAIGVYIPAEHGAYTSVFCAASEALKPDMSGGYFIPLGKISKPKKKALDMQLAHDLWTWTEKEFREKNLL